MNRLWKNTKRIWQSTNNIIKSIISKITNGTSSAMHVVTRTIVAIVSIVTVAGILVSVLLVSLPIGVFGLNTVG